MKKQIFISTSYHYRKEMQHVLSVIEEVVIKKGCEPFVFVNRYSLDGTDYQQMLTDALLQIDKAEIVIAEVTHKAIGVGIELGYAKAKGKQILYLYQKDSEFSTTVSGIANAVINYTDIKELENELRSALCRCV